MTQLQQRYAHLLGVKKEIIAQSKTEVERERQIMLHGLAANTKRS